MMNLIKQYQTAILFVVVVGVAYLGYTYLFAAPTEPALTTTETATAPDQDLIALLLQLKAIRLDNALFTDPLFQSLTDYSKELVVEPVGRPNPFAPLGGTAAPATPTTPKKP